VAQRFSAAITSDPWKGTASEPALSEAEGCAEKQMPAQILGGVGVWVAQRFIAAI
jgi:hypothetical protein